MQAQFFINPIQQHVSKIASSDQTASSEEYEGYNVHTHTHTHTHTILKQTTPPSSPEASRQIDVESPGACVCKNHASCSVQSFPALHWFRDAPASGRQHASEFNKHSANPSQTPKPTSHPPVRLMQGGSGGSRHEGDSSTFTGSQKDTARGPTAIRHATNPVPLPHPHTAPHRITAPHRTLRASPHHPP